MSKVVFQSRDKLITFVCKNVRHPDGRVLSRDEADGEISRLEASGAFRLVPNRHGGFVLTVPKSLVGNTRGQPAV